MTPEWLNENHGDYSQPWRGRLEAWSGEDTEDPLRMKRRREIWFKRFHHTLLKSPIVPLVFRLTVWVFSLTALALGASIQHMSHEYVHPQGPSALMAIIVDAVALVYLVYITWDEYTSKPLGLRSPSAKARLVLLDIFFIVFDSANLSLAFESLSTVSGACTVGEVNQQVAPKNDAICDRQIALASVLLIALLAWLTTFAISVLRYIHLSLSFSTMRRTNCFKQTRRSRCTVMLFFCFLTSYLAISIALTIVACAALSFYEAQLRAPFFPYFSLFFFFFFFFSYFSFLMVGLPSPFLQPALLHFTGLALSLSFFQFFFSPLASFWFPGLGRVLGPG